MLKRFGFNRCEAPFFFKKMGYKDKNKELPECDGSNDVFGDNND